MPSNRPFASRAERRREHGRHTVRSAFLTVVQVLAYCLFVVVLAYVLGFAVFLVAP